MFGGTKARRSMIETSNRQRAARDGSRSRPGSVAISEPLRRSQGPEPALRTQLSMDLMDSSQSQGDMPSLDDTSLVSTLKPSLQNARVASEPSLTPPDSPTRHMMDAKVEPRKRTWSLRSAKGRSSLKSMVDDLAEIKGRQDEELEYRAEEITQLKNQLSRLENEKSQMEDKVKQMRVHIDQQQHQLVDSVALQEQLQTLALENDQYQTSSRQKASMEAELVERDALNKHTIEALTKEVERLSHQLSSTEEKLQQSQEAIVSVAQQDTSAASKIESLTTEVEHLTYMLNDAGEKAIRAQEKLEQKIAALKKENELQKNTVTVLTERLGEAEENDFSLQQLQEEKLVQLNQLVEQDKDNQLTITSLNTKIQTLVEQNNSNDSMINSLNAKIQEWEDQDNASQLTIASLNAKVQQLTHSINDQDHKTLAYHKQQHAKIEELTEKDESYQKTISALTRNVDQLSLKLKENQENLVWYQSQLQEVGDREAKAQNTIAGLRGEADTLNQRLEEVQHSKTPLTQYERGGTVVALQKREAANKQTIKALENRLQHLTQKMTDSEQASLRVQREQLETIASLKTQMDQLRQYGTGSPNLLQKQQEEIIQKQKEESLKKDLIVETLNKKVEHYSAELQKNYANFSSWQAQQQEKDNEMQQHEAESQQTINKLRQQLNQLTHQRANGQTI
ncbi:interaptin-like isoform X2 [Homarus americanus]|uniref:interaptin-like isoform X2 n=1 Tax=Homarus americanus TaxID=6706 RepID=UPI001C46C5D3|nr:interaptin-like isoform X2 [Homarus americanus]